jgi:hypothetical protein
LIAWHPEVPRTHESLRIGWMLRSKYVLPGGESPHAAAVDSAHSEAKRRVALLISMVVILRSFLVGKHKEPRIAARPL